MIDLHRDGNIFTLTMNDGENRWNTTFVRGFAEALDEIEASEGPAAVVTTSSDGKSFRMDFGMVAGLIHDVPTVKELIDRIVSEAEVIINQRLAKIQAA